MLASLHNGMLWLLNLWTGASQAEPSTSTPCHQHKHLLALAFLSSYSPKDFFTRRRSTGDSKVWHLPARQAHFFFLGSHPVLSFRASDFRLLFWKPSMRGLTCWDAAHRATESLDAGFISSVRVWFIRHSRGEIYPQDPSHTHDIQIWRETWMGSIRTCWPPG